MKQGVLLLAHGAPERAEDVPEYLTYVRGGHPVAPRVAEEVRRRYERIGGGSPLLRWTRRQAEALADVLGLPVFFGMRNWHPFIAEAIEQIKAAGVARCAAIALAPQYSKLSVGLYFRRTEEALRQAGAAVEMLWTNSFHDHPRLIDAFAEKLAPVAPGRKVLFTAHSLPEKAISEGDPYDSEARATARLVAARSGAADWDFAYQSQGMTAEPWLGPTVESCLDRYAADGVRRVALAPIGFVCDHVEILYDVDVLFHGYARERGIDLARTATLNDSPAFIEALADVARRALGA